MDYYFFLIGALPHLLKEWAMSAYPKQRSKSTFNKKWQSHHYFQLINKDLDIFRNSVIIYKSSDNKCEGQNKLIVRNKISIFQKPGIAKSKHGADLANAAR